jgi:site-specific DNA-methyltransferase (adenine-specific)
MKWLKETPSESIHLIVTDPPYGINVKNDHAKEDHSWDNFDSDDDYSKFLTEWLNECYRVLVPGGTLWFFYGFTKIESVFKAVNSTSFTKHLENCIVWARHKGYGAKYKLRSLREEIMHLTKGNDFQWHPTEYLRKVNFAFKNTDGTNKGWEMGPDGVTPLRWTSLSNVVAFEHKPVEKGTVHFGTVMDLASGSPMEWDGEPADVVFYQEPHFASSVEPRFHTAQKPYMLNSLLILLSSNVGDTVLDTFMGSGSTGVASVLCERNFIGIERENDTFNAASNWIQTARYDDLEQHFQHHFRAKDDLKFGSKNRRNDIKGKIN